MNSTEIEFSLRDLIATPYDAATFPFDLLRIYNTPALSVKKLRDGRTNAASLPGDVLAKKHLFYRSVASGVDVAATGDAMASDPLTAKHAPRFIFVTDGTNVHIRDRKAEDTCNTTFAALDEHSDFLLPLAGPEYERRARTVEYPADVKATKRLRKLYDALLAANPDWGDGNHTHELNLFMTRTLFCLYAEDTGIFPTKKLFTNTVTQQTAEDGSGTAQFLDRIFRVMNLEDGARENLSAVERRFPYCNGSLFEQPLSIPTFDRTTRRLLLECGSDLDWTSINPDIFGSMIQTIATDGSRAELGMHYTSTENIMKVLRPLFLDDLNAAFEKAVSLPKLSALLDRLSKVRVFDPACGSGNFLVLAFKELRKLEMTVLGRIAELSPNAPLQLSGITLANFYGIELVDFACETAKLSLWIAEYQMNSAFREIFGTARPPLPLGKISSIHCANAVHLDWSFICPADEGAETYVCGNPPYQGVYGQTAEQRSDVTGIFASILRGTTKVDYVSCWFVKLSDYIASGIGTAGAFVATNSVCQGEQVGFLWPYVFSKGLAITFAYTSFKWENSASNNAGVVCVIIGIGVEKNMPRLRALYTESYFTQVPNINAYLVPSAHNDIVTRSSKPLNNLPVMVKGNEPKDGGHLLLSARDRENIVGAYPLAAPLIRRFYGSKAFLYNLETYALWISDDQVDLANSIPPIAERLRKTAQTRAGAGRDSKRAAATPHRFAFTPHQDAEALVIPEITTGRRTYLQLGLLAAKDIASNKIHVIYSPPRYLFALLSSRLHGVWARTIGGYIGPSLMYSNGLIYNTFPAPVLSAEQQRILADHSKSILVARAQHPGKTIAWLYNPETMPVNLLQAHEENDRYLEEYVYGRSFEDDVQRLAHLFAMYATMVKPANDHLPLLAAFEGPADD